MTHLSGCRCCCCYCCHWRCCCFSPLSMWITWNCFVCWVCAQDACCWILQTHIQSFHREIDRRRHKQPFFGRLVDTELRFKWVSMQNQVDVFHVFWIQTRSQFARNIFVEKFYFQIGASKHTHAAEPNTINIVCGGIVITRYGPATATATEGWRKAEKMKRRKC